MNIILNPQEVATVISLFTAQILDGVDLSEEGKQAIRDWRTERVPGREGLDSFTDDFNDALMGHIEESTRQRYVKAGRVAFGTASERARA
ncbi:MAG: hypothetical protein F4Z25_09655 [Chloroflexi bacterium]|nr:hypothetical protein [Chloroflexota bacterium]MYE45824.1 hypothetical protein [Chloroflexota bacterium]